jgi:hypothetical protein
MRLIILIVIRISAPFLLFFSASENAAASGIDLSPIVTALMPQLQIVGAAVFAVAVAAAGTHWLRRSLGALPRIDESLLDSAHLDSGNLLDFPDISHNFSGDFPLITDFDDEREDDDDYNALAYEESESAFEKQLARQDAGEYSPYDFIGSQVAIESGVPIEVDASDPRHSHYASLMDWSMTPEGEAIGYELGLEVSGTEKVARA